MKTLKCLCMCASLCACAAAPPAPASAASPRAPVAPGVETCVQFPSRSLPDPPPGYPSRVCWQAPASAGEGPVTACPASMALVTGGTLQVLSPEHERRTQPMAPFCIERSEVTVAAYRACRQAGACVGDVDSVDAVRMEQTDRVRYSALCNARHADRDEHPMNCVSWTQAVAYCRWRHGAHGALPTEEQWAFAARGATQRVYPWGDELPGPAHANRCGIDCMRSLGRVDVGVTVHGEGDGWVTTAPVGRFPLGDSPFAVHDLAGNVAEWTRSPYGHYRRTASGAMEYFVEDLALRVHRGGAWGHVEETPLLIDERAWLLLTDRAAWVGFRCVIDGA